MLVRQKVLLHLIDHASGRMSRLRLVKSAFLLGRTSNSPKLRTFYQFVPYRQGPFSFALYHDLVTLSQNGYLVAPSEHLIGVIPDVAIPPIHHALQREVRLLVERYGGLSMAALVDLVYRRYPEFTVNAIRPERRMAERAKAECAVYTIGYEGLQVDGFLNILVQKGIWQVIDVRSNPVSRRYGFHKSTLSELCRQLDIRYQHVADLGIPSELRAHLHRPSDYVHLFDRYEETILPTQRDAVNRITDWVQAQPSVLLCVEADPRFCHRSRLAAQIAESTGLPVHDLRGAVCNTCTPEREFSLQS